MRRSRSPILLLVALSLVALMVAGCGGRAASSAALAPRPDYLEADLPTLIARANAWTAASLEAKGQLRMYWSGDEDSRHVDARLFATRAGAMFLNGRRSLAGRIFDLVADGFRFQLVVPDHATIYTGTAAARAEPDPERPYFALRPHHMTEALLPLPLPTSNSRGSVVSLQTYPDRYALVWTDSDNDEPRIRRTVWIERVGLRVHEIEGFDSDGRIEFIATYSDYLGSGIDAFPGAIEVKRPFEELVFRFDLTEVDREPTIPPTAFHFQEPPSGYRTMTIQAAMAEFRRNGDS